MRTASHTREAVLDLIFSFADFVMNGSSESTHTLTVIAGEGVSSMLPLHRLITNLDDNPACLTIPDGQYPAPTLLNATIGEITARTPCVFTSMDAKQYCTFEVLNVEIYRG